MTSQLENAYYSALEYFKGRQSEGLYELGYNVVYIGGRAYYKRTIRRCENESDIKENKNESNNSY